jgi:hypothetical protein
MLLFEELEFVEYEAEQLIFEYGDPGDYFYILMGKSITFYLFFIDINKVLY